MNAKELVMTVANLNDLPRLIVRGVLESAGDVIAETLAAGDESVIFPRLGSFKSLRRAQRRMLLPNGQERLVVSKRAGKFVPGQAFRKRVNGEV